jgi:hypothetical protein
VKRPAVALALGLWVAAAWAYAIDLEFDDHGLDVQASAQQIDDTAIVSITNGEPFAVLCEATFRNGPEVGRGRRARIDAGETLPLKWTPQRSVVRLRIELWCESDLR